MISGAFAAAYAALGPQFENDAGLRLATVYGASSGEAPDSIPMRIARNEHADLVILSREALDRLAASGVVAPETRTDLVRSKIGMTVRAGTAKPDISTQERLVDTLLRARSIGYSASASGTYLSRDLFPRLGIWDEIKEKCVRISSERVGAVVARGEVEIGLQQVSEILPVGGADYVGQIPDGLQKIQLFSAGITRTTRNADGARRLLEYLASHRAVPAIIATGLDPVAAPRWVFNPS